MSDDEMRSTLETVRQEIEQLTITRQEDRMRIVRLENTVTTLAQVSAHLVTIVQSHDERLTNLVSAVERYVTARNTTNGNEPHN